MTEGVDPRRACTTLASGVLRLPFLISYCHRVPPEPVERVILSDRRPIQGVTNGSLHPTTAEHPGD